MENKVPELPEMGDMMFQNRLQADEAELVARLRAHDPKATEEVFHAHFDRLFSLVYHSVDKNRSIAEDITQDTFISALKAIRDFRSNSSLYTWLAGIANHKIADYYRRLEKERKNAPKILINQVQKEEIDIHDKISLEKALSNLPIEYRQVLILKYVEDMSVADISKVMKRSVKSIEGLLARSRKALREGQLF